MLIYRRIRFWGTDRQMATFDMETAQLVLSQFENFYRISWELNKVYLYLNLLVGVENWWSHVIWIVGVRFFWDTVHTIS